MTMGTNVIRDAQTEAAWMRSMRETTQAEVDERAAQHQALVRYDIPNGHAPHTAAAH